MTVDHALQKGIEAHKAGQLQEAARLYTAILKAQPKHPDANHNMGVLAVGMNKVQEALTFFKTALESNPNTVQFWLSYIDVLIKLNRLVDAKAVLDQAKDKGATGYGFNKLGQRLKLTNEVPTKAAPMSQVKDQGQPNVLDTLKLDQALKLAKKKAKNGSMEEAKRIYQDILARFPNNSKAGDGLKPLAGGRLGKVSELHDPSEDQLKSLINLYSQGELSLVVERAQALTKQYPQAFSIWNLMGASAAQIGQLDQAIIAFQRVLAIKPDNADAHNNMGVALKVQGKLEEAIQAFNKALTIKPDNADAYYNIGNALKEQGKLKEAIEAYNKALAIKPDYAKAYNNMGIALQKQGKREEAIDAYNKALAVKPDYADAEHMLSALIGKTTNAPPRKYVENLFDKYAEGFEKALVGKLEYQIPRILTNIALNQSSNGSLGSVLDLGCGTGLVGEEVKRFCDKLEGIDLSNLMLEQAKLKNVYDKLTQSDIIEYLSKDELNFDYFISTDVFVYVGNLTEVFRLIKSRNKKPGKLTFSTEHTKKDGFYLQETGRYTHSKSYIENLCAEFKFSISHFSTANLRKEKGQFLTGGLYVLDF